MVPSWALDCSFLILFLGPSPFPCYSLILSVHKGFLPFLLLLLLCLFDLYVSWFQPVRRISLCLCCGRVQHWMCGSPVLTLPGAPLVALWLLFLTADLVVCFAPFSFALPQFKMWFSSFIDSLTLKTSVSLINLLSKERIYVRACWRSVTCSADERLCHPLCLVFSYALGPGSPAFWLTWGSARGLSLLCLISPLNIWKAFSFRMPLFQVASPVPFPFIWSATKSYPWFLCSWSANFKKTQQLVKI